MGNMLSDKRVWSSWSSTVALPPYHAITNHVQTGTIGMVIGVVLIFCFILYRPRLHGERALENHENPGNNIVLVIGFAVANDQYN